MMASHIVLRLKEPDLERPYRTPGGIYTSGIAFALAIIAFISTFLVNVATAAWSARNWSQSLYFNRQFVCNNDQLLKWLLINFQMTFIFNETATPMAQI